MFKVFVILCLFIIFKFEFLLVLVEMLLVSDLDKLLFL